MKARKIIVYIATSADGYIARPDGDVEWLNRPRPAGNYGMGEFYKTIDTILFGRKTYAPAAARGGGPRHGSKIKSYVFSHQPPTQPPPPGVEFVSEPIAEFAQRLRATPGKDIWMMGGAGIIASFLDAGEIDEFIIHIIPKFIGEGIPLVAPRHRLVPLKLRSTRRYPDGVVRLHYLVQRQAEQPSASSTKTKRRGNINKDKVK